MAHFGSAINLRDGPLVAQNCILSVSVRHELRRFSERGQPCPRVSLIGAGLADKAVRAPWVAALPRCAVSRICNQVSNPQVSNSPNLNGIGGKYLLQQVPIIWFRLG
jgi:hypothetical protein